MSEVSRTRSPGPGQCATLACILEATAPKPGNVHRGADFEDLTYPQLILSAAAIGPAMEAASKSQPGQTIWQAVQATQNLVSTNSNLGMILLLAPLAAVGPDEAWQSGVRRVLGQLNAEDARLVYQAILLAKPGGLGKVPEADVSDPPPSDLLPAMRLAAERDLVAKQYTTHFREVLEEVVPALVAGVDRGWSTFDTIVNVHLQLMRDHPDSLIARKCGPEIAQRSADQAGYVLRSGEPGQEAYDSALSDLDFWLRSDGHRRNPGTTADLITAGLFVALRDRIIKPPYH